MARLILLGLIMALLAIVSVSNVSGAAVGSLPSVSASTKSSTTTTTTTQEDEEEEEDDLCPIKETTFNECIKECQKRKKPDYDPECTVNPKSKSNSHLIHSLGPSMFQNFKHSAATKACSLRMGDKWFVVTESDDDDGDSDEVEEPEVIDIGIGNGR